MLECRQVAVVDADQSRLRARPQPERSSVTVVHLHQHGHTEVGRPAHGASESISSERMRDNEQHRVRTHRAGLDHVQRIDGEVLAQHRQWRARPGLDSRSGALPPKYFASVRTLSAPAPARAYPLRELDRVQARPDLARTWRATSCTRR